MKAFALVFLLFGCVSSGGECIPDPDPKKWDGQLFVGDASKKAIVRAQSNTAIGCDDARFSEMICMSQPDFLDLTRELGSLRARKNAGGIPE